MTLTACQSDPLAMFLRRPRPPLDVGLDQIVASQSRVTLVGTLDEGETRGAAPEYLWVQTAGAPVAIDNPASPIATFVAPAPAQESETLAFVLTASVGAATYTAAHQVVVLAASDSDDSVTLGSAGDPDSSGGAPDDDDGAAPGGPGEPGESGGSGGSGGFSLTVMAESLVTAATGEPVQLLAEVSPLAEVNRIQWRQLGGPSVDLADADTVSPSFTAPSRRSSLLFRISAFTAGEVRSADVTVQVEYRDRR